MFAKFRYDPFGLEKKEFEWLLLPKRKEKPPHVHFAKAVARTLLALCLTSLRVAFVGEEE